MPTVTVTITHPTGMPSVSIETLNLSLPHEADSWARATFSLNPSPEQWALLSDETNDDNPLQINAYIDITRGTQHIFRGSLQEATRQIAEPKSIAITALDKAGRTNGAMATVASELYGSIAAPVVETVALPLYQVTSTDGYLAGNEIHYYPNYGATPNQHSNTHDSTKAWIARDDSRVCNLTSDCLIGATTFTVDDASQFTCPCFVSIGAM